jgi:hypothetical protein
MHCSLTLQYALSLMVDQVFYENVFLLEIEDPILFEVPQNPILLCFPMIQGRLAEAFTG